MIPWPYATRLTALRKGRMYTDFADLVSKGIGRKVNPTSLRYWEQGTWPRHSTALERWIRAQDHPSPKPIAPRPHISLSFTLFLDTFDAEEAKRTLALLEGMALVVRARIDAAEPSTTAPSDIQEPSR